VRQKVRSKYPDIAGVLPIAHHPRLPDESSSTHRGEVCIGKTHHASRWTASTHPMSASQAVEMASSLKVRRKHETRRGSTLFGIHIEQGAQLEVPWQAHSLVASWMDDII
jgi:hypothetical protein